MRVLILVQNLPVPFDRRVWQEAQALTAAVIATMTINSSASLVLRLKGDRSGAAWGAQIEPLHTAV